MESHEYAIYKGDEMIYIGTLDECAEYKGVKRETIQFYLTSAYQRKIDRRKNPKNYLTVIRLEDDLDEMEEEE